MTPIEAALANLTDGLEEPLTSARSAAQALRTHEVVRRLREPAATEGLTRAARASAALSGARVPVHIVRDAARGAIAWPDDAAGLSVQGTFRALCALPELQPVWPRSPLQAMARLHTLSSAGLLPQEHLGRPRGAAEAASDGGDLLTVADDDTVTAEGTSTAEGTGSAQGTGSVVPQLAAIPAPMGADLTARIDGLAALLSQSGSAPAVLVAALVMAEVSVARPFVAGNGVLARALARAVLIGRGVDANGICQWEEALLGMGPRVPLALVDYAEGGRDGVQAWIALFAEAVSLGAGRGAALADGVLVGKL